MRCLAAAFLFKHTVLTAGMQLEMASREASLRSQAQEKVLAAEEEAKAGSEARAEASSRRAHLLEDALRYCSVFASTLVLNIVMPWMYFPYTGEYTWHNSLKAP